MSKQTEKYKSFTQKKRNAEPDLKSRGGKKAKKVPNSSMDWDSAAAEIDEHLTRSSGTSVPQTTSVITEMAL